MTAVDEGALADIRARVDRYVAGGEPLTALGLYLLLEPCTPLLRFHAVLRDGPQNRFHNGLQQSYGDHNRLLALGLDALEAGDVDWYLGRVDRHSPPARDDLEECVALVRGLGLTRDVKAALWLAAALHDYGMFTERAHGLDVENAIALAHPVLEAVCPTDLRGVVEFAVRNHDFVRNVFAGEVPVAFLTRQLTALAPGLRDAALASLGMIQVAGAASLGEGRLSRARVEICRRCFDRRAIGDASAATRLARLLDGETVDIRDEERAAAAAWLGALAPSALERVERLLESALLHGWRGVQSSLLARAALPADALRHALMGIADAWADHRDHEHVVLIDEVGERAGAGPAVDWIMDTERPPLLNETRALVLRARAR